MRSAAQSWDPVAKLLHWLILAMIVVEVPVGYLMTSLYGPGLKHEDVRPVAQLMGQIHHTNGFFILFLVAVRLAWRSTHAAPAWPTGMAVAQQRSARLTQGLLYLLLLALPLSGWSALSVLADSAAFGKTQIWFFASDDLVPRLLAARPWNAPDGYGFYAKFHRWFIYGGAALLVAHIAAALWHHFVRRDGVLGGMWPQASPAPGSQRPVQIKEPQ
jgi:cytochrome b561